MKRLPILDKLDEDLAQSQKELQVDIPKAILTARAHGDLSENAEFKAAKEWSPGGMTEPKYFLINSGWLITASEIEQKIIPNFSNSPLYVVATETLSKTASTATPAKTFCSWRGIPSLL